MEGAVDILSKRDEKPMHPARPTVIIADNDAAFVAALRRALELDGFDVKSTDTGRHLLEHLIRRPPAALVVSSKLRRVSGLELCRTIRRAPELETLPVILLVESERHRCLPRATIGADAYLHKPISAEIISAYVKGFLHGAAHGEPSRAGEEILRLGDLTLEVTSRRVTRAGRFVHLGPTLFRLLHFLMRHPRKPLTYEEILSGVWPKADERPLDVRVYVCRLRQAINAENDIDVIRTVRAGGYQIVAATDRHLVEAVVS